MTVPPVAVVTGAAGGIGSAVVDALLTEGWRVVGVDLTERPTGEPSPGGVDRGSVSGAVNEPRWVTGDVADEEVLTRTMATARELGPVRGLVSAVLAEARGPLEALDRAAVTRVLDLQAVTAWSWSKAFVDAVSDEGGAIVHVSSVHAARAGAGMAAYAMAKAALGALTRATALEWGPRGVRCNAVLPGFVPVARNAGRWSEPAAAAELLAHHPLGRFVRPQDVAQAVVFLLSSRSDGITGATLPVDGGMLSALPDWA